MVVLVDMQTHQVDVSDNLSTKKRPAPTKASYRGASVAPSLMSVAQSGMKKQDIVPNFRAVAGHDKIFRSAAPDNLGGLLRELGPLDAMGNIVWEEPELAFLYEATFVLDLRMEGEGDTAQYRALLELAPGGRYEVCSSLQEIVESKSRRQQFRPMGECGFTQNDLTTHSGKSWIACTKWENRDPEEKKDIMIEELGKRGLPGLYEAIVEKGIYIRTILQAITIHLEKQPGGRVIFHCSIGKDRTGLVSMLCGKIVGMTDDDVCDDFSKSVVIHDLAIKKFEEFFGGKVDSYAFAHADKIALGNTMEYLRTTYGSITQYLDAIDFGPEWRSRFRNAARS